MKKNLLTVCICALLVNLSASSIAQKLSFGEYTGINFSNLHGNLTSNKWEPKAGPSAGFVVEYDVFRTFALQSEISFLKTYYEMKSYQTAYSGAIPLDYWSSSYVYIPYQQPANWDFSFLRIPVIFKYKTPTRLQFELGGGLYYSFLMNDDITKTERENAKDNDQKIYPPTFDWGYLFTTDLSYPVTDRFRLFLSGRYSTGRKVFIENYEAKNGSGEILFGFKYSPVLNRKSTKKHTPPANDSIKSKCFIKPVVGIIRSWNSGKKQSGNYSANYGLSTGVVLGYNLNQAVSLQTGVSFERKGYSMNDSSIYYHRFAIRNESPKHWVDSDIALDYLSVPVKINLSFGEPFTVYANIGIYTEFMVNALCRGTSIDQSGGPGYFDILKTNINNTIDGLFKSVDFGFSGGMGFQVPVLKNIKLDAGISYAQGLINILKTPENSGSYVSRDDLSFRNSQVSLQIGLQIPISN